MAAATARGGDAVPWFENRLAGGDTLFPGDSRGLDREAATAARAALWADYKTAATRLGWDREILENTPVPSLRPSAHPKLPDLKVGEIPCDGEKMPY